MLPVVRPPCSRENAPLNACSTAVSRVRSSALLTLRRCKSSTEHTASWQIDPEAVPFPAGQLQTVNNSPVLGHKLVTTQVDLWPGRTRLNRRPRLSFSAAVEHAGEASKQARPDRSVGKHEYFALGRQSGDQERL